VRSCLQEEEKLSQFERECLFQERQMEEKEKELVDLNQRMGFNEVPDLE